MCQYRYFYYQSCRHQQTVLVAYCERGAPASPTPAPTESPHKRVKLQWRGRRKQERRLQAQILQEEEERGLPAEDVESSSSSFHSALEDLHIHTSSLGSASITEDPYSETETASSIAQQQHQTHSSQTSVTGDMAGLRPFGVEAFRTWMAGNTSKQAPASEASDAGIQHDGTASSPAVFLARVREPGIRAYTDESCDLPDSSDILQHLAESPRNLGILGMSSDEQEYASQPTVNPRDSFDFIEAEVDALKEEILRLKEDRERVLEASDEHMPSTSVPHTTASDHFDDTQAAIDRLSPAARLQLQHALEASNLHKPVLEPQAPTLPTPLDFPCLGAIAAGGLTQVHGAQPLDRKLSYATAAATSVKVTGSNTQPGTRAKRADSKIPAPVMHISPRRSAERDTEDDRSVIVSPQTAKHDPAKSAPRFAQPTKSFARRADETLRRDSINAASRPGTEASPMKSMRSRAPDLDTEKRAQSHSKRKSLPDGWIAHQPEAGKHHATSEASLSPTIFSSPTSDGDWQLVGRDTAKEVAAAPKAGIQQQSPHLRKKTSTYMSPTAATTQRTIVTLSEENIKRPVHKVKSGILKLDTERAKQFGSQPSPDSIGVNSGSSASSSAIEQLAASVGLSPKTPAEVLVGASKKGYVRPSAGHHFRHEIHAPVPSTAQSVSHCCSTTSTTDSSRIARARRETAQEVINDSALSGLPVKYAAETSLPSSLTSVPNTVTKRRTSHADILKPIFDKLDNHGLRKVSPERANISKSAAKVRQASAEDAARDARESLDRQVSAALSDVALLARQGNAGKKMVLPPHLCPKKSDAERAKAEAKFDSSELPVLQPAISAPGQPTVAGVMACAKDRGIEGLVATNSAILSRSSSVPAEKSTPSSLRATARTFEPLWKPKAPGHELGLLSWQGSLDRYSDEQWAVLPEEVRHSICTLRQYKMAGTQVPAATMPNRISSPSKRAEQRFWAHLVSPPVSESATSATNASSTTGPTSADGSAYTTSPNGVQPGQVLKPTLSPGKKTVKWTLQDTDGQEKSVSFGRAPPPPPPTDMLDDHSTPCISPTSDDTSPIKTPHSARAWTIGAGYATRSYGWKGGDGREISFSGYGPQAEWNASSPVTMDYYAKPPLFSPVDAEQVKHTEYQSPTPKVWPRSQKQWAEYAGYGRVPCGDVEILSAVEQLPLGSEMFGQCADCVPNEACVG